MKYKLLQQVLVAGAVLAGSALAANGPEANLPVTDTDLAQNVQHRLLTYSDYSAFDEVTFQVRNGQVTLAGEVTEPFKKSDMRNIVAKVAGVQGVTDNIQVLPFSDRDNLLRREIAASIGRDPSLSRYQVGTNPAIHIVVDNGRVTLTGFVNTQADKVSAALRAETAGLPSSLIANNLQVVTPSAM
jgi:hyperosmotically inducible periplasmic protein